jgi:hypothetical protein
MRDITNANVRERAQDAFMAGAESCFTSITLGLDPAADITDNDMQRIGKIWAEIEAWRNDRKLEFAPPGGRA